MVERTLGKGEVVSPILTSSTIPSFERKDMKSKVLICYHKKDVLLKNNVLTPIFLGQNVAEKKQKMEKFLQKSFYG